jgi:hypothetical protein
MPKPTPGETPTRRHSGLDPESRVVKLRREAPQIVSSLAGEGLGRGGDGLKNNDKRKFISP